MKKITRAMELIAASRIIKAQQRAQSAGPYARELTRAVSAVATYSSVKHPLTTEPENPRRAAVLLVTSDRGLAGAYSSNVIKEGRAARRAVSGMRARRSSPSSSGRKGEAYFKFRGRPVERSWQGFSDQPTYDKAEEMGQSLVAVVPQPRHDDGGVDEVHVVYTRFKSMLVPRALRACRMLPLEVVEGEQKAEAADAAAAVRVRAASPEAGARHAAAAIRRAAGSTTALLQAAASELAARQQAMKSATDNADELIKQVHPAGQPGPPGRDHPGNQRDRRRRQRARGDKQHDQGASDET
ncbi:MAG: F0F1 ATP synthase subunit gamma [Nocardioides sp.]